jgi:hypothetical protein
MRKFLHNERKDVYNMEEKIGKPVRIFGVVYNEKEGLSIQNRQEFHPLELEFILTSLNIAQAPFTEPEKDKAKMLEVEVSDENFKISANNFKIPWELAGVMRKVIQHLNIR